MQKLRGFTRSFWVANTLELFERFVSGPGNDIIAGFGFPAATSVEILGGGGDDRITAGEGNDYIAGGPGRDVLNGGFGSNVVDARTGDSPAVRDDVNCGPHAGGPQLDFKLAIVDYYDAAGTSGHPQFEWAGL